jgi:hypothetical protein
VAVKASVSPSLRTEEYRVSTEGADAGESAAGDRSTGEAMGGGGGGDVDDDDEADDGLEYLFTERSGSSTLSVSEGSSDEFHGLARADDPNDGGVAIDGAQGVGKGSCGTKVEGGGVEEASREFRRQLKAFMGGRGFIGCVE